MSVSITHPAYAKKSSDPIPAPTSTATTRIDDTCRDPLVDTPTKPASVTGAVTRGRKINLKDRCKVCLGVYVQVAEELWVGCGHVPGRDKRACKSWVHQRCVWLMCGTSKELEGLPIYCPEHMSAQ